MRRSLAIALVTVVAACGGDSPPVPSTITFTPASLSLDAIGTSAGVSVVVTDSRGRTMDNAAVTWSSSGDAAALTPPVTGSAPSATHAATVASAHEGETLVTATAGSATATLHVVVDQIATGIVRIAGDNQIGAPGAALVQQLTVVAIDRAGAPVANEPVTFTVVDGGGSLSASSVTTGTDGVARVSWTLGTATTEHVSASIANPTAAPVTFTASAVAGGVTGLVVDAGGNEAVNAGADAPTPPRVKVVNAAGVGVPGITVGFAVTAGGGSINAATAVSGADGVAALTRWTMGPVGALNEVTATVQSVPPLAFDDAGCDNPATAPGFTIALCYRTTMTTSQRQAFVSAATKWSAVISGDLPDVPSATYAGACGGSVPTFTGPIDDLLIFATVEPIDGTGQIVGSAGPCVVRSSGTRLSVVGTMRFDVADVVSLDNRGLLNAVILHEMGHVLGIGTFWSSKGLLQNPSSATSAVDTYYSGTNGIAGFDEIGGTTYTGGNKVPVENTGGAGTINGHWREVVLKNELMTGTINNSANPLSALTARSLIDLGYTINTANYDPFFLTLAVQFEGAASPGVTLGSDILAFPLWSADAKGHLSRVPR